MRPSKIAKLGLGYEALCKENLRLIYCNIWAFGNKGPMADNQVMTRLCKHTEG